MTIAEKKAKIKLLVEDILNSSYSEMINGIDKALNSGSIDIEGWCENDAPLILPKSIAIAIIENEADRYNWKGAGNSFQKKMKMDIRNIKLFL